MPFKGLRIPLIFGFLFWVGLAVAIGVLLSYPNRYNTEAGVAETEVSVDKPPFNIEIYGSENYDEVLLNWEKIEWGEHWIGIDTSDNIYDNIKRFKSYRVEIDYDKCYYFDTISGAYTFINIVRQNR